MQFWLIWVLSAVVLLLVALVLGGVVCDRPLGILVDGRGRYSLAHFQMVIWTIVVFSLIAAVALARQLGPSPAPALDFWIPPTLFLVTGISLGSAVGASAIKGTKDQSRPDSIAASNNEDRPQFLQLFTLEEGALADKAIDIGKFQNFWLTLILVVGYVFMALDSLGGIDPDSIAALPDFPDSMIALLAISHAAYLANKLPNREGEPQGLTVERRDAGFKPLPKGEAEANLKETKQYSPRNPPPKSRVR